MKAQSALLRVIEHQSFERVGGRETVSVNVRIVAATNEDLEDAILEGRFRADLFYRLRNVVIQTPPLRDRYEDVPEIVRSYLELLGEQIERVTGVREVQVHDDVMSLLTRYSWPGNVRQLQNVVNSSLTKMGKGDNVIRLEHIPLKESEAGDSAEPNDLQREMVVDTMSLSLTSATDDAERRTIVACLEKNRWSRTDTAKELGISRVTLYNKMKRHGIQAR